LQDLQTQVNRLSKGEWKVKSEKVQVEPPAEQEPNSEPLKGKPGRKVVFTAERLQA